MVSAPVGPPYRLGQIGIVGNVATPARSPKAHIIPPRPYRLGQIGIVGNDMTIEPPAFLQATLTD